MRKPKIKPQSIVLLRKLLKLPDNLVIYDPLGLMEESDFLIAKDITSLLKHSTSYKVCVNLSGSVLEILSFDFILEMNSRKHPYASFFCEQFVTINNPDHSIRWFMPAAAKHPYFLALYNGSGWKASLFDFLSKCTYKLGLGKWICHGSFSLYAKEEGYFKNQFEKEELAVFTGTTGPNRKAVVVLFEKGIATHFIKIPISKKSKEMILSEHNHLKVINEYDFDWLAVPVSAKKKSGLQLTNVRPQRIRGASEISDIHLQAIKNIYSYTFQVKRVSELQVYNAVETRLSEIKSLKYQQGFNINSRKVERLAYNLKVLLNTFDNRQLVPVAYAHGDFTPWNMFVGESRIHLYDWELAMPEQLLLYDAFHFIFQSGVLISHHSFEQIKIKIASLQNDTIVQDILSRYGSDFRDCYHWYLLYNCSYYLDLYIRQESLHPQAHWLIDCWITASNDAIKSMQRKVAMVS